MVLDRHSAIQSGSDSIIAENAFIYMVQYDPSSPKNNLRHPCELAPDSHFRPAAPLLCYTRAFGDEPRNCEPWSSDVDDTGAGTQRVLSGTGLEHLTTSAKVRYLDHSATAATM
ncbi:hypothetical protein TNCV_4150121 [Trichonephila clavipes]|uniref:Uncharacterized protein n=1 Tax=Trichonephila clavipes TaxID=2585209 RepID=A0A8X6W659_TRICX|nr:hypothetical protein TNCV_4150121 [Trichonephila clavipes]